MCHITGSENQKTIAGLSSKDTILDLPKDLIARSPESGVQTILSAFSLQRIEENMGTGGQNEILAQSWLGEWQP